MSSEQEPLLSSDSEPPLARKLKTLLEKLRAQELSAAASALAVDISDLVTADFAEVLAESASAYANSPWEDDAAARLTNAAEFVVFFTNQTAGDPGVTAAIKAVLLTAADVLPMDSKTIGKQPKAARKLDPSTLADATAVLAAEHDETDLGGIARACAYYTSKLASAPDDDEVKALFAVGEMILEAMATGTEHATAVSDLMAAADLVYHNRRRPCFQGIISFLRHAFYATPEDEEWLKKHLEEVQKLQKQAFEFAEMAAKSSMAHEAAAFSKAVDGLALSTKNDGEACRELSSTLRMLLAAAI